MIELYGSRPTADALAERIRAACLLLEEDRYVGTTGRLVLKILKGDDHDSETDPADG